MGNGYGYVGGNAVNRWDPIGRKIYPTSFVGPLQPDDQRGLTVQQYKALLEVLRRERQFGTQEAAYMSSITFGDALLDPFNSSRGITVPIRDEGDMDLDWYTDVVANTPDDCLDCPCKRPPKVNRGGILAPIPPYIFGKFLWDVVRLYHHEPIANWLPFQDPGERVAILQLLNNRTYKDLFDRKFFDEYAPPRGTYSTGASGHW